jgi:hypothetical protein
MGNVDDKVTYALDMADIMAGVGVSEHGAPQLVIGEGPVAVQLVGGRDPEATLAGARRIVDAAWNYMLAVKSQSLRRLKAEGQDRRDPGGSLLRAAAQLGQQPPGLERGHGPFADRADSGVGGVDLR